MIIEQCASAHSTFYNGLTGDVMVCEGGHLTAPVETPGKALPEPPIASPDAHEGSVNPTSPIPSQGEHGSIPQHMEDDSRVDNI